MEESLEEVKNRLSAKYIGKLGIHGFGVDYEQNAVRIHHSPGLTQEITELLTQIEREAAPYRVVVFTEEAPRFG
jgi:hypothetical protein